MASPPQAPPSQPSTRVLTDVFDQVLRFVQQPSANVKNPKSGSTRDLNADFNHNFSTGSSSSHHASHSPILTTPSAERSPWPAHEHEASPLSPSGTLVASGSSNSSSSTPRSRYRSLKRTESSGSTNSSASRSTETQGRAVEGRNGKGLEKAEKGKRLNVSDRLRRLGKKMQAHKSSLSSPKVSAGELADDSDSGHRMRPSSVAYSPTVSSGVHPTTEERSRSLHKGKAKQSQPHAPGAHAKLLSMVAEADESGANSTFYSSSGSGATTPTLVQTPAKTSMIKSLDQGTPNNDDRSRDDPPEPMTLAARIQALITGLPFPSFPRPETTGNGSNPSESPSTSTDSPALQYSPGLSSFSGSPLPMSPPPLPSSPLPALPRSYDVNLDVETDTEGRPIPPPYASPLPPRERMILEEFLSSPVIMNGELPQEEPKLDSDAQGTARETSGVKSRANGIPKPAARVTRSIWSVLESMGTTMGKGLASSSTSPAPPFLSNAPTSPPAPRHPTGVLNDTTSTQHENESMFSDTGSSVMIYSPLIPSGAQDLPELAEVVPVVTGESAFEGHSTTAAGAGAGSTTTEAETLSSWIPSTVRQWSFVQAIATWSTATPASSGTNAPEGANLIATPSTSTSGASTALSVTATPGGNQPPSGPISTSPAVRKAWVPSTTKMSVQAMWWGYRLYLPPPVMAVLSDHTLEASKRAALITSALTWFFANLPITALPPPLQPAALLLQRIAPFLGYIGAFISWSWGVIEGYDLGYGVTLTATWLLPMALIPGTWHKDEFPMSPSALGQPVPLPQILYSPAPTADRPLGPVWMAQSPVGSVLGRVTEFLPLPTPTPTESTATPNMPVPATPLQLNVPPSPSTATQPSPLMTPTPTPPTPISPSLTPRPRREPALAPSTHQYTPTSINSAMPSPASSSPSNYQTPLLSSPAPSSSSHYQTPLLSSPAPTSSSQYQTPLLSPLVLPLSPLVPPSTHPLPSIYRATPVPESIPASPSRMETYAPIHSPQSTATTPPPSYLTHTPRPRPHSKSKSTSTNTSIPTPNVPTSTNVQPVLSPSARATQRPYSSHHQTKATVSSRNQGHPGTRPPLHSPQTPPVAPWSIPTHAHSNPNPTSQPAPVPVGSQLEQHLLSGPLMSPIALPEVDLPEPGAAVTALPTSPLSMPTQTLPPAPVPVYAYSDKEERKRERDRDKARLRERAKAIFRRTDSSGSAGTQRAKA